VQRLAPSNERSRIFELASKRRTPFFLR